MTQLVYITNRVNNAAIRRIRNDRGDLVYVVPSYTLPDNVVMNGGLYPADEIERSYHTLEDTPAPAGHPYNANGDYISANSPDGILYFQCGIFNKNVQRVSDDKYGHRVYLEKHIHVETAMKTERGKRIIEAIDRGEPIHTSTGILLEPIEEAGVNAQGVEYTWRASAMMFDHDAILLDEEGAATPDDGVGLLVNHKLVKQVQREGKVMSVNTINAKTKQPSRIANESMFDLQRKVESAVQSKFKQGADNYIYMTDFGADYAVFEMDGSTYRVGISIDGDTITVADNYEEVSRVTAWERVSNAIKSFFNREETHTTNQEGKDMGLKALMQEKLGDAYNDNMTDEEMLNAYEKFLKGNAADKGTNGSGEQNQPEGEAVVNADVAKLVADEVAKALAANKQAEEAATRADLAEKLKANGVELTEAEQSAMSVNSLQKMVEKTSPVKAARNFAGGVPVNNESDLLSDTLPE